MVWIFKFEYWILFEIHSVIQNSVFSIQEWFSYEDNVIPS